MSEKYCEMCGVPFEGDGYNCAKCESRTGQYSPGAPQSSSGSGGGIAALGCALPLILGAFGYFMLPDKGGSGLIIVGPIVAGLVIGIPLAIYGMASSSQKPESKDEDTPPPVL